MGSALCIVSSNELVKSIELDIEELKRAIGADIKVSVKEPAPQLVLEWALPAAVALGVSVGSAFFNGFFGEFGAETARRVQSKVGRLFSRLHKKAQSAAPVWRRRNDRGTIAVKSPPISVQVNLVAPERYELGPLSATFIITNDIEQEDLDVARLAMFNKIEEICRLIEQKNKEVELKLQNPRKYYGPEDMETATRLAKNDFWQTVRNATGSFLYEPKNQSWIRIM